MLLLLMLWLMLLMLLLVWLLLHIQIAGRCSLDLRDDLKTTIVVAVVTTGNVVAVFGIHLQIGREHQLIIVVVVVCSSSIRTIASQFGKPY
jgi:hypothetical protein